MFWNLNKQTTNQTESTESQLQIALQQTQTQLQSSQQSLTGLTNQQEELKQHLLKQTEEMKGMQSQVAEGLIAAKKVEQLTKLQESMTVEVVFSHLILFVSCNWKQ